MASMSMTEANCTRIVDNYDMEAFSVLENHYMMNRCFLEEGQLLKEADKIAAIPAFIVNGRYDVICPPVTAHALSERLKTVKLEFTRGAHSANEPETSAALVRGVKWVADRIQP
jgi:proline iminopeptidase